MREILKLVNMCVYTQTHTWNKILIKQNSYTDSHFQHNDISSICNYGLTLLLELKGMNVLAGTKS